jgi:hypothetical protein
LIRADRVYDDFILDVKSSRILLIS